MTTDQLTSVVAAGGGIIINAGTKTVDQLRQIVAASVKNNAKIIITSIGAKTTDQLRSIASVSPGNVIFDLRDKT